MAPSLLIVEDDPALRQMLLWELGELGYRVTAAENCADARSLRTRQRFDLALLDYQLPDGDGIALMEELHRQQPGLPVILCSALGCRETEARALRAGARRFVPKPASAARLHRLFQKVLEPSGS